MGLEPTWANGSILFREIHYFKNKPQRIFSTPKPFVVFFFASGFVEFNVAASQRHNTNTLMSCELPRRLHQICLALSLVLALTPSSSRSASLLFCFGPQRVCAKRKLSFDSAPRSCTVPKPDSETIDVGHADVKEQILATRRALHILRSVADLLGSRRPPDDVDQVLFHGEHCALDIHK